MKCSGRKPIREYQEELQGITDGLKDHGVKLDIWDVVAMNAFAELPDYYVPWLNEKTAGHQRFSIRGPSGIQAIAARSLPPAVGPRTTAS